MPKGLFSKVIAFKIFENYLAKYNQWVNYCFSLLREGSSFYKKHGLAFTWRGRVSDGQFYTDSLHVLFRLQAA